MDWDTNDVTKWANPQAINLFEHPDFAKEDLFSKNATFFDLSIVDSDVASGTVWIALSTNRYKSYFIKLFSQPIGSLDILLLASYDSLNGCKNDAHMVSFKSDNCSYFAMSCYNKEEDLSYLSIFNATVEINDVLPLNRGIIKTIKLGGLSSLRAYDALTNENSSSIWTVNSTNGEVTEHTFRSSYAIRVLDANISSEHLTLVGSGLNITKKVHLNVIHPSSSLQPDPIPPPDPKPSPTEDKPAGWWVYFFGIMGIFAVAALTGKFCFPSGRRASDYEKNGETGISLLAT